MQFSNDDVWSLKHASANIYIYSFKAFPKWFHPACTQVAALDESRSIRSCFLQGKLKLFFLSFLLFFRSLSFHQGCSLRKTQRHHFKFVSLRVRIWSDDSGFLLQPTFWCFLWSPSMLVPLFMKNLLPSGVDFVQSLLVFCPWNRMWLEGGRCNRKSPCIEEEASEDEIPAKALELKKTNWDSFIGWDTFHVTVDTSPETGLICNLSDLKLIWY